jgi:heme exporter protein CcmD
MTPHTAYIVAAYGFTAMVVLILVLWSYREHRRQRAALSRLEQRLGRSTDME